LRILDKAFPLLGEPVPMKIGRQGWVKSLIITFLFKQMTLCELLSPLPWERGRGEVLRMFENLKICCGLIAINN
jgi:hypothetical protein